MESSGSARLLTFIDVPAPEHHRFLTGPAYAIASAYGPAHATLSLFHRRSRAYMLSTCILNLWVSSNLQRSGASKKPYQYPSAPHLERTSEYRNNLQCSNWTNCVGSSLQTERIAVRDSHPATWTNDVSHLVSPLFLLTLLTITLYVAIIDIVMVKEEGKLLVREEESE